MGEKRVVEITKPEVKSKKTFKKGNEQYGRNYYNKYGDLLRCMSDGCNTPRPRGAAYCRKCALALIKENAKRHKEGKR